MHSMQIISAQGVNGVSKNAVDFIRALLARGHPVTLVHRPGAWIGAQDFDGPITLVPTDLGRALPPLREIRRLRRLARQSGVQVVHTHASGANTMGVLLRLIGGPPVIGTAHGMFRNVTWRLMDRVITLSPQATEHYQRVNKVRADRVRPTPLVFSAAKMAGHDRASGRAALESHFGIAPQTFVIGVVGQICDRKNQSAAVEIAGRMSRMGIDVACVLIGPGDGPETDKITAAAKSFGIQDHVILTGPRDDVPALLAGFDALLCTSHEEQSPVALLEAMALSVPVFSTDVGCVADMIPDGRNGALFSLSDLDAPARTLAALAQDPMHAAELGRASRQVLDENFAENPILDRILAIYAEIA